MTNAVGWMFFDAATGWRWSKQHPVDSARYPAAVDIDPMTADKFVDFLKEAHDEWLTRVPADSVQVDAGEGLRDALENLIRGAEQRAFDDGDPDLVEATPEYDEARDALAVWDAVARAREEALSGVEP